MSRVWVESTWEAEGAEWVDAFWGKPVTSAGEPSSRWSFEQPHVARDLLVRLYATMGEPRDAKLEAEIDVFLAATRRP